MKLTRLSRAVVIGLGLAVYGMPAARAEDQAYVMGQSRTWRGNEGRTGYGYNPADPTGGGLPSNQMPSLQIPYKSTTGTTVYLPTPDLTWIYPLDKEGADLNDAGNQYPIGYMLDQIRSSPVVAGIELSSSEIALAVIFGSSTTVHRDVRNNLPTNRQGDYVDPNTGVYSANLDPFNYLDKQTTGCVYAIEAFAGTTESATFSEFNREFKPFWWYGVRNLPFYLTPDDEDIVPGFGDDRTFEGSPSRAQHRFFINASDTAMRAFDYSPQEARSSVSPFGPENTSGAESEQSKRLGVLTQWLAPALTTTTDPKDSGPGIDSGAGVVGKDRPDIPERLTDRLYNLSITGKRLGLTANAGSSPGALADGPLDNRFRQLNGIGAINSSGLFVHLPNTISYTSAFYNYDSDTERLRDTRRDPANIKTTTGLQTNQLYIVGSNDGFVYAFDALPQNSRRVPASGGAATTSTYMGRLVWAFNTAMRAEVFSTVSKGVRSALTVVTPPVGEYAGANDGVYVDPTDTASALVAPYSTIITGPVVSSPVSAELTLPSTAFSHAGETRMVIFVGSSTGRMFCLDASTGEEIWEFKTTPVDQGIVRKADGTLVRFDSVAGAAITTSPTLGYLPAASSQLRPSSAGRVALFFGAADGKVYALDAADGSPIRNGTDAGWDVQDDVVGGSGQKRYRLDHFGFVTYPFEKGSTELAGTEVLGKFGRTTPAQAKPVIASVVARPIAGTHYVEPGTSHIIPQVDALFVSSQTNYQDATVGTEAGFSGGTVFCVTPLDGTVKWTFDRWNDVTRTNTSGNPANSDFDKDPTKDYTIRPSAFVVTPAYATKLQMFSEAAEAAVTGDGESKPLTDQNVLFAIDNNGKMYPLRAGPDDDNMASVDRLYWRVPFPLPSGVAGEAGVYSSPVVTSPNQATSGSYSGIGGRSYVYVGVNNGIVAVDTTETREQPVTDVHNELMTPNSTGGELTWGWQIAADEVTEDTSTETPTKVLQAVEKPLMTTPAIHAGYVFAGGDNGLMYAWANQLVDFSFDNVGGGGRGRYRNNWRRPVVPEGNRPPGGATTQGDIEFYVDAFQAGFDHGFTNPASLTGITPIGAPPGATTAAASTTPSPIGVSDAAFQQATGAVLEWGDGVGVVAWGPGLDKIVADSGVDWGRMSFQLTGPGTSGTLRGRIEKSGVSGVSRQIFYLNPFGSIVPLSLRYPYSPRSEYANPLRGQMLRPGWNGQPYTVTAYYQPPEVDVVIDGNTTRRRQPQQKVKIASLTKFHLANPLNMMGFIESSMSEKLASDKASSSPVTEQEKETDRNGNERIPIVNSVIGDHGTNTVPQYKIPIVDRSHLPRLRTLAGSPGGDDIGLRVRFAPARLRWQGGPKAVHKPLLVRTADLPNGMPLDTLYPPEPLYAPQWGQQVGSLFRNITYIGAETPPFEAGEDNKSLDYPDIESRYTAWVRSMSGEEDVDATDSDAPLYPLAYANFYMRVSVPKYQPSNFSPSNVDPGVNFGVGPGYYTVNPMNSTAFTASLLAWNPGKSNKATYYGAFKDATNPKAQTYANPLGGILPTTAAYVAQEPKYLTRVYVDVNRNGSADTDSGEPYRMFVAGVQVRPNEALRVATTTIDVPRSPETNIPAGFIPFPFYYDRQGTAVGAPQGAVDSYLFGERALYSPFAIYNTGNVNLWNLRMDKLDPYAGHLEAAETDHNPYFGADDHSNWPGSGKLKRFNLFSTLDVSPKTSAEDPNLWTPARKPSPGTMGDEGQGRIIQVKDVFSAATAGSTLSSTVFANPWDTNYTNRPHGAAGLNSAPGLPYLTVAVPPGTPPGRYATPTGRFVVFEDSGPPYNRSNSYDAILNPGESGVSADAVVMVNVGEARFTDKTSRLQPYLPNADVGVALAAQFTVPGNAAELAKVWQALAHDTTPAAYRDPATGDLVTFWSSNRVGIVGNNGFKTISPFVAKPEASDKYHIFASAMTWRDPINPPVTFDADPAAFVQNIMQTNPWGWQYQGGNGGNFFFPKFDAPARWFGEPSASPWLPDQAAIDDALGAEPGSINPEDLNYTSPAVITDFHGVNFPRVVFFTGTTGVGANQRSAIFYAPVDVDRSNGTVGLASGSIQAVGVANGKRTLDPFTQKFAPRPFLITAGGDLTETGAGVGQAYLRGERVIGLGVVWFGGAPGAWKLYVSTIPTDNSGSIDQNAVWKTTELVVPVGVGSALHPSVYYHQLPKVFTDSENKDYRQGILEMAFTGYNRSARNPDIYVTRYVAMKSDADGGNATIGDWGTMGFARKGGDPNSNANKPLEPLLRVAGEPRPVFRSRWANWLGRRNLGVVIYWFQKPVRPVGGSGSDNDYTLFATFTARQPGANEGYLAEVRGRQGNSNLPAVTAFIDFSGGTVRFTTTDPVKYPAPMVAVHPDADGVPVQDFIYVSANPYALRVTADDDISDTMPQIWIDETHDVITDPGETNAPVSESTPLVMRRDRMWLLWRRSATAEGATRQSSLFYSTFRLAIDTGIAPINTDNGKPVVELYDKNNGSKVNLFFTVDRKNGRIFLSGANDGDEFHVHVNGTNAGRFTVGWQPENLPAPIRYGTDVNGRFRLPMSQWTQPRAVPVLAQGNDSMPWMFKDPFSDVPPGDPLYFTRGNNSMWLFWASTRPSRSMGNVTSSPSLVPASQIDPYYFNTQIPNGGLMYAGSASDVYYTTLSPDFRNK